MPTRTPWDPATDDVMSEARMDSFPRGWLGYAELTAAQSVATGTETDVTGLSVAVTVGANRRIRVRGKGLLSRSVADGVTVGRIKEGSTELDRWAQHSPSAVTEFDYAYGEAILTPTAGAHTYKLTIQRFSGTGSVTVNGGATTPASILVEDIGPAS